MVDINVWLALTWDHHPQHTAAARWYGSIGEVAFLFSRFTMLGFLRLLTNRQVMGGSTLTLSGALRLYDRWAEDPRVQLVPEPRGTEMLFRQALAPFSHQPATKAIADCYLIGFAEAAGANLVTFDRGLAGVARFREVPFVLLQPVEKAAADGAAARKRRDRRRSAPRPA